MPSVPSASKPPPNASACRANASASVPSASAAAAASTAAGATPGRPRGGGGALGEEDAVGARAARRPRLPRAARRCGNRCLLLVAGATLPAATPGGAAAAAVTTSANDGAFTCIDAWIASARRWRSSTARAFSFVRFLREPPFFSRPSTERSSARVDTSRSSAASTSSLAATPPGAPPPPSSPPSAPSATSGASAGSGSSVRAASSKASRSEALSTVESERPCTDFCWQRVLRPTSPVTTHTSRASWRCTYGTCFAIMSSADCRRPEKATASPSCRR